jgi:hypothetical protein
MTYANVIATLALFVALGGTSYAVLHIRSSDVVDNSLRSRDIRDNSLRGRDVRDRTLRARDVGRDSLGPGVIKESTLELVPRAQDAQRVGGATAEDLRLRCPPDTEAKAGVCIESSPRSPDGFLGATDRCDQVGRGLVTMAQLDPFARTRGPLSQPEWTASVYRNPGNGQSPVEQLEAVVLEGGGNVSYDRVYLAVQHPFRCVALPSN